MIIQRIKSSFLMREIPKTQSKSEIEAAKSLFNSIASDPDLIVTTQGKIDRLNKEFGHVPLNKVARYFHGTTGVSAAVIQSEGFQVPKGIAAGRTLGNGVYSSGVFLKAATHGIGVAKGESPDQRIVAVVELILPEELTIDKMLQFNLTAEQMSRDNKQGHLHYLAETYGYKFVRLALQSAGNEEIARYGASEALEVKHYTHAAQELGYAGITYHGDDGSSISIFFPNEQNEIRGSIVFINELDLELQDECYSKICEREQSIVDSDAGIFSLNDHETGLLKSLHHKMHPRKQEILDRILNLL